ncbi:MAG: hypothetical protein ACFCU4_02460 [Puniceicoccaceae bacterium]
MDQEFVNNPLYTGLNAVVRCDSGGEVTFSEGEDAEILGGVVSFIGDISNLIGNSFGLDQLEEAQIQGRNTTAVCINQGDGYLGLLFDGKARAKQIIPEVLKQMESR